MHHFLKRAVLLAAILLALSRKRNRLFGQRVFILGPSLLADWALVGCHHGLQRLIVHIYGFFRHRAVLIVNSEYVGHFRVLIEPEIVFKALAGLFFVRFFATIVVLMRHLCELTLL